MDTLDKEQNEPAPKRNPRPQTVRRWDQILRLQAKGFTYKEIARKLGISERQVYNITASHRRAISGDATDVPRPKAREDLDPVARRRLENSAAAFEDFFFAYSGEKLPLSDAHREWIDAVLRNDRVLINCPPRHGKSTLFTVWLPIWLICRDRNEQILLISKTGDLVKKFSRDIAYHLSHNTKLIQDYGSFKPEDKDWPWRPLSGEMIVDGRERSVESGDFSIKVLGARQQIIGMEATTIIVDDPDDPAIARSEAEHKRLSEWFHEQVMTRLEPGAKCVVIGQRVHLNDLYGELAEEQDEDHKLIWRHLNYPAVLDWDNQTVLWPEKWTWKHIMKAREDTGAAVFSCMYQQEPLAEDMMLARPSWLYGDETHVGCVDMQRPAGRGIREQRPDDPIVRVLSIDPSPTAYAGLIVADVVRTQMGQLEQISVLECISEKMQVRDMVHHIDRCIEMYQPDDFIFEQNAAQRWFLQDKDMDRIKQAIRVLPHNTTRAKGDPGYGLESLAADFEFGKIRFPYGDAEGRAMSERFFLEAKTYPQGKTEDLLMALWFIKFNVSRLQPKVDWTRRANETRWHVPPRLQRGFWWQQPRRAG